MGAVTPGWPRIVARLEDRWPLIDADDRRAIIGRGDRRVSVSLGTHGRGRTSAATLVLEVALVNHVALPAEAALAIGSELELGAIALRDGAYVLRHAVSAVTATLGELDAAMGYLVEVAAAIRAQLAPAPIESAACFDNWGD